MDHSGPTSVEVVSVELPVPFEKGRPTVDNRYNTATYVQRQIALFPNGVELIVRDGPSNGIWIEGEKAEIFVSRNDAERRARQRDRRAGRNPDSARRT